MERCVVTVESMDMGAMRMDKKFATRSQLSELFGIAEPHVAVRDPDGADTVELLPVSADGTYADLKSGGKYLILSAEQMRNDDDDDEPGMTREKYMALVMAHRARMEGVARARRAVVERNYKPLHPELWQPLSAATALDPAFAAFIDGGKEPSLEEVLRFVRTETSTGIFSFSLLQPAFCAKLVAEVDHFSSLGVPSSQPNTMNHYGVILDDLGLGSLLRDIRQRCISPLAKHLYPHHGGGSLDAHHGFAVSYSMDTERDLGFHYDASHITLNVCLGETFEGGELFFKGRLEEEETHSEEFGYKHVVGRAVLHIGKHRHGAHPLVSGRRINLIVWCRSSELGESEHGHSHGHGGTCSGHGHSHDADSDEHDDEHDDEHGHSHAHGGSCGGHGHSHDEHHDERDAQHHDEHGHSHAHGGSCGGHGHSHDEHHDDERDAQHHDEHGHSHAHGGSCGGHGHSHDADPDGDTPTYTAVEEEALPPVAFQVLSVESEE